jgi:hypothetical protein
MKYNECNVYIFSVSRVSENWNSEINCGIICANDGGHSLGTNSIQSFTRVEVFEDDELTQNFFVIPGSGEIIEIDGPVEGHHVTRLVPFAKPWEKNDLGEILATEEECTPYVDGSAWASMSGEDELRDIAPEQARGGLVINLTPYNRVPCEINNGNVEILSGEPNEECVFVGLRYPVKEDEVAAELQEALEYMEEYDGSPSLLIQLLEKYKSTELKPLEEAWDALLKAIPASNYWPDHIGAARIADEMLDNKKIGTKIIEEAVSLIESGFMSAPVVALADIASYAITRKGISADEKNKWIEMLKAAGTKSANTHIDEIAHVFRSATGLYDVMGDDAEALARQIVDKFVSEISDAKSKTKITKALNKELDLDL